MFKLNSSSRTTEVDAVSDQLVAMYKSHPDLATDLYLKGVMTTIEQKSELITDAIKRLEVLNELDRCDAVRDDAVRTVGHFVNGFANMPTEAARNYGPALKRVFDNYTLSIVAAAYDAETSLIESMLGDYASADMTAAVNAFPALADAITQLRAAQQSFATTQVAYLQALARDKELPNASKLKYELLALINGKLVKYLDAMQDVDSVKYGVFATEVAKAIDEQNSLVALRKTLAENEKKKEQLGTQP